jgi:hypothetical protein
MFSNPVVAYYAYQNWRNNMDEQAYYTELYGAVTDFLRTYCDTVEVDEGTIDCVVGRVDEALEKYVSDVGFGAFISRLEGSSTYVACDLSETELDEYVSLLVRCLNDRGLL